MAAVSSIKNGTRERSIDSLIDKKDLEVNSKICPKCSESFAKNGRVCPKCGTWYKQFLIDNPENDNHDSKEWSPTIHYSHVPNHHPKAQHKLTVMDPLLGNPNSRYNIHAMCHLIKKSAKVKDDRLWTYLAADAAIALQVR